jgi:DNA repair exonuclease SbcCD nuclease subunit
VIRFLHTSDWQLGMTRHFLSEGAQERYSQARFDAIRAMGNIAKEENCRFMLVCGDAFESNQVDRKTVARALEALKEVPVPVFILPGNHDPLNAASIYRLSTFMDRKPAHVHVIENASPIRINDDVEIVGAFWTSKRPVGNPVEETLAALPPANGIVRICAAHGAIDKLTPDPESAGVIPLAVLEQAIDDGKVHYVALGDRHSVTNVSANGRIWYSGSPEATDFDETKPGYALVVDVDADHISIKEVQTGHWQFIQRNFEVNLVDDVESLSKWLEGVENKERTVLRLNLVGSLTLSLQDSLQTHLIAAKDVFAALDVREDRLLVVPDDTDFADLGFSGFADAAVQQLRARIEAGGDEGNTARDALMLLLRLARSAA